MNAMAPMVSDRRAERLAVLAQLERRARSAEDARALAFVMVNDSRGLLDYRQALFWSAERGRLETCSGLATLDPQAPFVLWLNRLCASWSKSDGAKRAHAMDTGALAAEDRAEFAQYYGQGTLLWLPLRQRSGDLAGALVFHCDKKPSSGDFALMELLLDCYGHAWAALQPRSRLPFSINPRKRRTWIVAVAAATLLLLAPMRQSALAPAEIVAHDPAVLRAPLQAVVERILVQPNQDVAAGEPVVRLDTRDVESRLQTARQEWVVADAEYRQAQQQALFDERGRAGLSALKGRLEQARADVDYFEDTLGRMTIIAPRAGVAIYDDPGDWVGRPVALGERIMQIADPSDADLEILLPVADAIELDQGAEVRLFLNSEPGSSVKARLERIGYRASPTPDGVAAYRLKAVFDEDDPRIRIGLKGSAKLYGEQTTLFGYLLRRPLTALRARLGW